MPFTAQQNIGIIYNFPSEYNVISQELARRNHSVQVIHPDDILLDPQKRASEFDLIYNDLSAPLGFTLPSNVAHVLSTYSRHFEVGEFQFAQGRIVNPSHALDVLSSRAKQLSLFSSLNISFPKTRIFYSVEKLVSILPELKFPVLLKRNNPFDNTPILRFDSLTDLLSAVISDAFPLTNDVLLVQEYRTPKNNQLFQVDVANGRFIGARRVHTIKDEAFRLDLQIERDRYTPSPDVIQAAEEVARAARIDLGTIEYFIDRASNQVQFFAIGPYQPVKTYQEDQISYVLDFFERRLQKVREVQLAL